MSNIKNNTTSLQNILDTINSLPESGGGGIDTSDATASADEIFLNETAYVNGEKITGTFTIQDELTTQDDLIEQITSALEGKVAGGNNLDTSDATASASDILADKTAYVNGEKITGIIESVSAKTITPSKSTQTAVSKGVYTTGAVTVAAIPNEYIIPNGTMTITKNGTYNVSKYASAEVSVAGSGGGSGEASIPTCSVRIVVEEAPCEIYYTTQNADGTISYATLTHPGVYSTKMITTLQGSLMLIKSTNYINFVSVTNTSVQCQTWETVCLAIGSSEEGMIQIHNTSGGGA